MNNPTSEHPDHALYPHPPGCTGARLLAFSGLERAEYLRVFDRRNVISGRAWSMPEARRLQPGLRAELAGRTVVLLGAPVNSIMRGGTPHELAPPFVWTPDGHGGWMTRVPHPSGLNHFYNDPLHRVAVEFLMRELVEWSHTEKTPASSPGPAQTDLFGV